MSYQLKVAWQSILVQTSRAFSKFQCNQLFKKKKREREEKLWYKSVALFQQINFPSLLKSTCAKGPLKTNCSGRTDRMITKIFFKWKPSAYTLGFWLFEHINFHIKIGWSFHQTGEHFSFKTCDTVSPKTGPLYREMPSLFFFFYFFFLHTFWAVCIEQWGGTSADS